MSCIYRVLWNLKPCELFCRKQSIFYKQNPLEKLYILTIYQNYILALMSKNFIWPTEQVSLYLYFQMNWLIIVWSPTSIKIVLLFKLLA